MTAYGPLIHHHSPSSAVKPLPPPPCCETCACSLRRAELSPNVAAPPRPLPLPRPPLSSPQDLRMALPWLTWFQEYVTLFVAAIKRWVPAVQEEEKGKAWASMRSGGSGCGAWVCVDLFCICLMGMTKSGRRALG